MGIKSKEDWTGTVVNGVTLGEPKLYGDADENGFIANPISYEWDGGVPNGFVDSTGKFKPDGKDEDGKDYEKVDFKTSFDVDDKEAKFKKV